MFGSTASMVLHLEGGTCESGANCNSVNYFADTSTILMDYHPQYLDYFSFACASCHKCFSLLSGLLQHVETEICDGRLGCSGALDDFLEELLSCFQNRG